MIANTVSVLLNFFLICAKKAVRKKMSVRRGHLETTCVDRSYRWTCIGILENVGKVKKICRIFIVILLQNNRKHCCSLSVTFNGSIQIMPKKNAFAVMFKILEDFDSSEFRFSSYRTIHYRNTVQSLETNVVTTSI